jgi:pimeloyl-ACP methyl ester carboxylesterase
MNDLYPFQSHYQCIAGHRLHYLDEGSGEPVVMVHGNPSWSFYYRNLVRGLRGSQRCIVPDHIGCGLSDKPGDDRYSYMLRQRVADLEALLDRLSVKDNITLVVHDWGGMIGMAYAVRHPERIARLVILNTGAFHLPESKGFPWQLRLVRNTPLGAVLVRGLNLFCRGAVRSCVTRKPMSAEVRAGFLQPYDSWANRIAVLRFVQDIPLKPGDPGYALVTEVQDNLRQLAQVPMLICWGLRDFVFDRHFLAEWERRFPLAEVHRFADAGHYVLEDAGEEILSLVRKFLAEHPLPAAVS